MSITAPGTSGRLRRYRMSAVVLGLGIGSILLLVSSNRIQQRWIARDIGALRAVEEIQTRIAVTHLWIEEYVTGDEVDLGKIEDSLGRAGRLAAELAARSPSADAGAEEREIRDLVAEIEQNVARFAEQTWARRSGAEAGLEVGIGSEVDVEYDRTFARLESDLARLGRAYVLRLAASERRARLVFRSLLIAWAAIVLLAVAGLWSRERHQRRMEAALGDSQARLIQAQKMEAVGRLAGGLAHDINNYLAAIAAQCELVKMKAAEDDPVARRMDAVLATTGRAGALIQRLLAFSRRQPARPEPVLVNQVVESMDSMLNRLLGDDVEVRTDLAPDLWPVEIDVSQLEQVILNLAVNAREAMATGGTLRIATRNVPGRSRPGRWARKQAGADFVALTVDDTGPGVPESIRKEIFDPFFTTKEEGHSGLGLATVLGVVEQNGGRVTVESRPAGARFRVLLPRGTRQPRATRPAAEEGRRPLGGSGRILLVEDNEQLRRSTRDLLASRGYRVTAAADGEEALAIFDASAGFDLLVTDVVMPGLSGRRLAETLRARAPELPVLYISGHTEDVVLRHGIEAGEVDLLSKPFTSRELAERVRSALGLRAAS